MITHGGKPLIKGKPLLVGVINLSPESFFKESVADDQMSIANKIQEFIEYDVDCLDVGAMSTRPLSLYGGKRASIDEELSRIKAHLPQIIALAEENCIPVALDTQFSEVAELGISMGISIINDISGLKKDDQMATTVASAAVDLVVMATQHDPGDVCGIDQTISALNESLSIAHNAGIANQRISIDPGFGGWQGRSKDCDLELLMQFERFREFNLPIYVGVSRKSTIATLGGGALPADRLAGSIELTSWLIDHGASIIRTHDVKETRLALNVKTALNNLS